MPRLANSKASSVLTFRPVRGSDEGERGSGSDEGKLLARACKTAAHELLHMYGIGHCLHRACLMNGTGHIKEDFAAPPVLCPVCLAKMQAAWLFLELKRR